MNEPLTAAVHRDLQVLAPQLRVGCAHELKAMAAACQWPLERLLTALSPLDDFLEYAPDGMTFSCRQPLQWLNLSVITAPLADADFAWTLLPSVDSTNTHLKSQPPSSAAVSICLAEQQTAGRGRSDRFWFSPLAQNLYLSLKMPFDGSLSQLFGLSLVIGLAVCEAIEAHVGDGELGLQVKWPNDIFSHDQKLAGILIETQSHPHGGHEVIIGVGVNVNLARRSTPIDQPWTSLWCLTGVHQDRNALCTTLVDTLYQHWQQFLTCGFRAFQAPWARRDFLLGKTVTVITPQAQYDAEVLGVDACGGLRLLPRGEKTPVTVFSGEVELRRGIG